MVLYHPVVRSGADKSADKFKNGLRLDVSLLKPGMRLAVGLSGGADSVALLRALTARSKELGLVIHAAHLHHGLRGDEANEDCAFARGLAEKLGVPFHEARVDVAAEMRADAKGGKQAESLEEAARRLRYGWFRELMAAGEVDAVATAHTLDDQAETVLGKFLRGAWTEGLAGIAPKLDGPDGPILRPLLDATRAETEAYLRAMGQPWREDSSNRDLAFTRNRIRHELLPLLEGWNPRLREHMAQMAVLAREEESWWQAEVARVAPQLLLPGRPVRGGGRAAGEDADLSLDRLRLAELPVALQRRLLRYAAEQFGVALDFAGTEAIRELALCGRAGQKLELPRGLRAERTVRELQFSKGAEADRDANRVAIPNYSGAIPGTIEAQVFGVRLRIESDLQDDRGTPKEAVLRNWRAGDRVRLRYSSGPRKVKEVLERIKVTGTDRTLWPVLEVDGRIVWMKGVELEPLPGITITATPIKTRDQDQP